MSPRRVWLRAFRFSGRLSEMRRTRGLGSSTSMSEYVTTPTIHSRERSVLRGVTSVDLYSAISFQASWRNLPAQRRGGGHFPDTECRVDVRQQHGATVRSTSTLPARPRGVASVAGGAHAVRGRR